MRYEAQEQSRTDHLTPNTEQGTRILGNPPSRCLSSPDRDNFTVHLLHDIHNGVKRGLDIGCRRNTFQAKVAVISNPSGCREQVQEVDLAGAGLVPAGDVRDVDMTNDIDIPGKATDQISFVDLVMVGVEG